jgi:hypothetical protein
VRRSHANSDPKRMWWLDYETPRTEPPSAHASSIVPEAGKIYRGVHDTVITGMDEPRSCSRTTMVAPREASICAAQSGRTLYLGPTRERWRAVFQGKIPRWPDFWSAAGLRRHAGNPHLEMANSAGWER